MITAIGEVMKRCYEKGWITTRDGNVSVRKGQSSTIYITPSGIRKNTIRVEDILKLKYENGLLVLPEGIKPSGELEMHFLLLKDIEKTRSVLHVHPTHVIAAMYAGFELSKIALDFPEIYRYTRVGPNVPKLPAISKELADSTYSALHFGSKDGSLSYDIVGQMNHGVCSVATDPWSAYEHIERLDHICEIVLKSGVKP